MFFGIPTEELIGFGCMAGGFLVSVFGYRCIDIVMSFFGSIMGAIAIYWLSLVLPLSVPVHIVASFLTSLVLSFTCLKYKRFPCTIIGLITSTWMANAIVGLYGTSQTQTLMIGFMFLVIPMVFAMAPVVCILASTSFYGSWLFVTGINQFVPTGFPNTITLLLNQSWGSDITCGTSAFLMGVLCFAFTMLTLVLQFFVVNKIHEKDTWELDSPEVLIIQLKNDEETAIRSKSTDDILLSGEETPYCEPIYEESKIDKSYYSEKQIPEERLPLI